MDVRRFERKCRSISFEKVPEFSCFTRTSCLTNPSGKPIVGPACVPNYKPERTYTWATGRARCARASRAYCARPRARSQTRTTVRAAASSIRLSYLSVNLLYTIRICDTLYTSILHPVNMFYTLRIYSTPYV